LVVHLPGAGGGYTFYNLSRSPYAELRQMLAERGCWIIVPNLGNSWMNDQAVAALDKIIDQICKSETIDPARVHLIGTSMGAGSGLIYVSLRPKKIRSVCALFPMTDFNTWMKETPRFAPSIIQAYGSDPTKVTPVLDSRSPIWNAEAFRNVPVYLLHGDNDNIVPPHHSRDFAVALRAKRCDVTYHEVPGFGHDDQIAEAFQREIADFLTKETRLKNTTKR